MATDKRFVIVNGDDFGFSDGVNHAIIEAHQQGILSSTSLMVTGAAATEAVELAKTNPELGVGLHLVLVCGQAVLPPEQIPHLVDASGAFISDPFWAGLRYQFSRAAQQELRLEIKAQLERFQQTGLPLSHVDGHLHLHMHPVVLNILLDLAETFPIKVIRFPREELSLTLKCDRAHLVSKLLHAVVFWQLSRHGESLLKQKKLAIATAERVYGLLQTGQITEDYLLKLIPQIQASVVELYGHPALPKPGEPLNGSLASGPREFQAFSSEKVRHLLAQNGFELVNFHTLIDSSQFASAYVR